MAVPTKRSDRGASLVEFALLAPLLFLLLIGTVTAGLTLSRQNSVKNAVREAARFGAVVDFSADIDDNLTALYQQTVNGATGDLNPNATDRVVCVAQIDDANEWYYHLYTDSDSPIASDVSGVTASALPPAVATACDAASVTVGAGTNRVWVRATRSSQIEALLFDRDVTLQAKALTRNES